MDGSARNKSRILWRRHGNRSVEHNTQPTKMTTESPCEQELSGIKHYDLEKIDDVIDSVKDRFDGIPETTFETKSEFEKTMIVLKSTKSEEPRIYSEGNTKKNLVKKKKIPNRKDKNPGEEKAGSSHQKELTKRKFLGYAYST